MILTLHRDTTAPSWLRQSLQVCGIALAALSLFAGSGRADPLLSAEVVRRYEAPEANQGVAADDRALYAVGTSEIGRYDRTSGRRTGGWLGDPKQFPHLNSCAAIGRELVCAASNYPATPMRSTVEIFDLASLAHKRSIRLGRQKGSLTWVVRKDRAWWACFANYDGKGGEPGRDHRATIVVKFDRAWRRVGVWRFPPAVLARLAPRSASGGVLDAQGLLYVTGHDAPEVYVLRAPPDGDELEHLVTVAAPIEGQAIALDPADPRRLYGISRSNRQVVEMRLPDLPAR